MLDDLPDGTMIYRDNMDEQELEEDAVRTPMAYLGIVPSLYAMMVIAVALVSICCNCISNLGSLHYGVHTFVDNFLELCAMSIFR